MLGDKGGFDEIFKASVDLSQRADEKVTLGYSGDKVNELLEASSSFMIGDREFTFNESESIFFITEAIDSADY